MKKVQPKPTEQQKAQEKMQSFVKDIEAVYEKHGLQLVTNPAFKIRDDGTYSIVLQQSIGQLPKSK